MAYLPVKHITDSHIHFNIHVVHQIAHYHGWFQHIKGNCKVLVEANSFQLTVTDITYILEI